jgi:hypothetical protein
MRYILNVLVWLMILAGVKTAGDLIVNAGHVTWYNDRSGLIQVASRFVLSADYRLRAYRRQPETILPRV